MSRLKLFKPRLIRFVTAAYARDRAGANRSQSHSIRVAAKRSVSRDGASPHSTRFVGIPARRCSSPRTRGGTREYAQQPIPIRHVLSRQAVDQAVSEQANAAL